MKKEAKYTSIRLDYQIQGGFYNEKKNVSNGTDYSNGRKPSDRLWR